MSRLSSPLEELKNHYSVVVVGSGYGGGIAASRLARAGQEVCLLERGREIRPGEYPDTQNEAVKELQANTPDGQVGSRLGMFDFHVNKDINALVGCGLGGTSLINANVSLRAVPEVWQDERWPAEIRADLDTLIEEGYGLAEKMLAPTPYPEDSPSLKKLEAMEQSAEAMGVKDRFYRLPINVTFKDGVNAAGVEQKACTLCGDCVSGCNHWAKNTTLMNYLPDAWAHGAKIFTSISVRHLARKDGKWLVHYQIVGEGREKFDAPTLFVTAEVVVISAGTLGSSEIMLRSKAKGLATSDRVGEHFSGNGDVLGFGYNCDQPMHGVGWGSRAPGRLPPAGPCITGIIDERNKPNFEDGFVIEEGVVPGAIGRMLPVGMGAAAKAVGKDTDSGFADWVREKGRAAESLIRGPYHGAIDNTQTYLVMSHDRSSGKLVLEKDRLRIDWPEVGDEPIFETVNERLYETTKALGGTYTKNPIWSKMFENSLISVHPLGGCRMAESAAEGVVNHKGQAFTGSDGTEVYDDLYVTDGSVVPLSLGVNPLLTISAVSERMCRLLAEDRGWTIDYTPASGPLVPGEGAKMGIRFTETMRGFFSTVEKDDYEKAAEQGKDAGSSMQFTLTITSGDLDTMLENPAHLAKMVGTLSARALSAEPLSVTDGTFNLFISNPEQVETRNMVYRMKAVSEEGKTFFFHGFKTITDSTVLQIWPQTTTLYVTVHDGDGEDAAVLGKGILKIAPVDFMKQMTTMEVTDAPNKRARLEGLARFGKFFAGVLYESYGGVFVKESYFDPEAAPRKKRLLRAGAPEIHPFRTSDGVDLRLTRYRGGSKGPVLMVHGAGVASSIFSTDLIETNLVEYLYAHGYDLWLLDFRVSVDLPASEKQSNGDQCATIDHPEAVAYVRRATGAESIQAVVHCYGSNTFFMALLAGMEGVRSVVSSQIAINLIAPTLTKIKTGLHVPSFLEKLGFDSLTAYVDTQSDWREKLFDKALKLFPVSQDELCRSPVCHRITFLYSLLYEHQQLTENFHDNLHELFGMGNITTFEHLAEMVRRKQVVSLSGEDVYMPHLDRLAIPIRFIHGAENQCYKPESTLLTKNLLSQKNGESLYSRFVIEGYGHLDCIFGKKAVEDVYPLIVEHLDNT